MHSKKITLTNFSRASYSQSNVIRPENEYQLLDYMVQNEPRSLLVRGSGLSYNDSCFNTNHLIIDSSRFNHFISFDQETGILVCQGGVLLKDLFLIDSNFIPAVIPGTLYATVAGSIAHDVHGKNNPHQGSFGHHLIWLELLIGNKKIRCSREENHELFYATIGGLGLTGIITHAALRLKKASRHVQVENRTFLSWEALTEWMCNEGLKQEYQAAWVDLLHPKPRAILSLANPCAAFISKKSRHPTIPQLPFNLLNSWSMKLFNQFFFHSRKKQEQCELIQFNNPLDSIQHWNRLYGRKGLIQFQAVFDQSVASATLKELVGLIRKERATPTLAVLKLFTQPGTGLLSFCKPGFTLAVDFVHNQQARLAIKAMNQLITELNGQVYLAKDLELNAEQYQKMYKNHVRFTNILSQFKSPMNSDLAKRLGIIK